MQSAILERKIENNHWLLASEAVPYLDKLARSRTANFLGGLTLERTVQVEQLEDTDETTLMAAIQEAAAGDLGALDTITTNVRTDVAERLFKAGHQTKVLLESSNGHLSQNGHRTVDILANTFEYTPLNSIMWRRAVHETKNAHLFDLMNEQGIFDDFDAVVFSFATKDIDTKKNYGFFEETDTCSIQLLTKSQDKFELQTALVAGKISAEADRHDVQAVEAVFANNGCDVIIDDVDDGTKYVMLIPKGQLENGVASIVEQYDDAAGGTFYGEQKPRQNYAEYALECENRNFDAVVQKITQQLLREAKAFDSPIDAVKRLDYLSDRICVGYAVDNHQIDTRIFGTQAALHIEQARHFIDIGAYEQAENAINQAKKTSTSSSCPFYSGGSERQDSSGGNSDSDKSEMKWMKCPHCSASVYDDPCAKVLSCWDCKATVINGVVVSKGDGGSKKRAQEKKLKQKTNI